MVTPSVPQRIQSSIIKAVGDFPMKSLFDSGAVFNRYIKSRKAPMEEVNIKLKMKEIEELVMSDPAKFKLPKLPMEGSDEHTMKLYNSRKQQKVKEILKQRVYSWQPVVYDKYKSLLYLISRSAEEYAVILKVFREIQKRDPTFSPRSYFDFGSGVGSGVWAASELWKESIYEYYLIDSSKDMNDLSDLLLRDGDVNKSMFLRNVYHRQFLPSRVDKYDVVLSAYSLLELPALKNRLEVVNNLWNKAGQYLVFIESGTNAGFQILNEIRDFIMHVKSVNKEDAFVFSPCPHENPCPRYQLDDGTPCNFEIGFNTLPFSGPSVYKKEPYSYLVMKKGTSNEESDRWPRIIRPTLIRHKHAICRMCTKEGKIQDGIFTTAKHGKFAYRCAKGSNWGDQLPLKIIEPDESSEETTPTADDK